MLSSLALEKGNCVGRWDGTCEPPGPSVVPPGETVFIVVFSFLPSNGYLLMALQEEAGMWLTWHFPAPPSRTAGRAGPDATYSSVGLLGLASASGPSHLTFYKTAWDSRTGPTILAEASFLVVNGAGSPAVHCSQGLARHRPQKQN